MAYLSPETRASFDRAFVPHLDEGLQITIGFGAIGAAIGAKRSKVSADRKELIFEYVEYLLNFGSDRVSNAVATSMLEAIWYAVRNSGFDFTEVDAFLGREGRRYLVAWDDFNATLTPGLTRQ